MNLLNYLRSGICLLLLLCNHLSGWAQEYSTPTVLHLFQPIAQPTHFDTKAYVSDASYLKVHSEVLQRTITTRPQRVALKLPTADGTILKMDLNATRVLSDDFLLTTSEGDTLSYERGMYYAGTVNGDTKSMAAISVFRDMVMGVVVYKGEQYVLGHLNQNKFPVGEEYVFYKDSDLVIENNFSCATGDLNFQYHDTPLLAEEHPTTKAAKVVKTYFEADNRLYRDKGNNSGNVTNYVTGLFSVVRLLYQNEQIDTEISQIFVWTNSDPYPTNSSSNALTAFQDRLNGNYNGDLAHLLSTVNANNGGIAYLNALCAPLYGVAYSNIGRTYNLFPTYSWTVTVVTHEIGHNLGSPHTQSCNWPGGALDNCYPVEGNCSRGPAPINGGTIMSYCHLSQYGINFQNGFGTRPGNLIRSRVAAASCLSESTGGGNGGGGGEQTIPNLRSIASNLNVDDEAIRITQRVTNTGSISSVPSRIGYYLSEDPVFSASDYFVGSVYLPSIFGNTSSNNLTFVKNIADITNVPAGTYFVIYFIDYEEKVSESNEGDNRSFFPSPLVTIVDNEPDDDDDNGDGDDNGGDNGDGDDDDDDSNGDDDSDEDDGEEEEEEELEYCSSAGNDANFEWIANVQIGDLNSSSESDGGYRDFTARVANLMQGSENEISLNAAYAGDRYSEFWRIWIDMNQDGTFSDNELLFESDVPRPGETRGVLRIPSDAPAVTTRMRVSMKWFGEDNRSQSACGSFGYGEVEDYTVVISGESATDTCRIINLEAGVQTACDSTTNTYSQEVLVYYDCDNDNDEQVTIGIYINDNLVDEVEANEGLATIVLTDLPADGTAVDLSAELCFAEPLECLNITAKTLFVAPTSCQPQAEDRCNVYPSERSVSDIGAESAKINWTTATDASYYQVRMRVRLLTGWSFWFYFNDIVENQVEVNGLNSGTRYQFGVRTYCQDGWTNWSPDQEFTTLEGGALADPATTSTSARVVASSKQAITALERETQTTVFPNPTTTQLHVNSLQIPFSTLTLYRFDGTLQQQITDRSTQIVLDTATLPSGLYYLEIKLEDGTTERQTVVKL